MAAARFEITGVSKAFQGGPFIDFFSLEIREGEFLSIVGPGAMVGAICASSATYF